jgi:ABC-type nickel/cobalt efflux system permease component RcnA
MMLRKYGSLIAAILLVAFVATACIVRTRPAARRGQPAYVEKHKKEHRKDHRKHRKDHRKDKRKHDHR